MEIIGAENWGSRRTIGRFSSYKMRVHETVPVVLLLFYQAVNKDGEESCTLRGTKPISGEYLGELLNNFECEALVLRRGLVLSAQPDVFCVHKKLYRYMDEPSEFKKAQYTLHESVICAQKQICEEDELTSASGIMRRWMRVKCVEGNLFIRKNSQVVSTRQLENIMGFYET